jgi:hypothetical protein
MDCRLGRVTDIAPVAVFLASGESAGCPALSPGFGEGWDSNRSSYSHPVAPTAGATRACPERSRRGGGNRFPLI